MKISEGVVVTVRPDVVLKATVDDAREVFGITDRKLTHGGARGKRGKNKKLVFEAAFSGTSEDHRELAFPLLCSLGAIPSV